MRADFNTGTGATIPGQQRWPTESRATIPPTMRPPALLFDLDGTLADTLEDICATANAVREGFGLPSAPLDVARTWVGHGARWLLEQALDPLAPDGATVDLAYERYCEHHEIQCTGSARPYPGVVERLETWHRAEVPMAVVTNKPARFAERVLDHLGLARLLPVVIAGDTLAVRKPHPEPVLEALRRLGATTAGAWMIGDSEPDIRSGKAAGIRTAGCLFGFRDGPALRAEQADEYWTAFGQREDGTEFRWPPPTAAGG